MKIRVKTSSIASCLFSRVFLQAEFDLGPFLLTQYNPIHGWIQFMSNSAFMISSF